MTHKQRNQVRVRISIEIDRVDTRIIAITWRVYLFNNPESLEFTKNKVLCVWGVSLAEIEYDSFGHAPLARDCFHIQGLEHQI